MQTQQRQISVGEGYLYYETAGEGAPLVLTHAAFLDSRMFDALWDTLAQRFQVIRYDMRGFGQSSPVSGPLCRRDDLTRLLDVLGIQQAHLVGCSMGGQISLDVALEQPDRVASLTVVASTPSGFEMKGQPPRYLFEMMDAVQRGEIEAASELAIRIWLDGEHREPQQINPELRQKALAMNCIPMTHKTFLIADTQPVNPLDPPATTRLESVQCPTLIVTGGLDHSEVQRAADEMGQRIPNAQTKCFEACGHVPSYEQPDKFATLLLDFLQESNRI